MIQNNNSNIDSLFLHLLSAAIWDKPADAALFERLDTETWNEIANMARRQTVSALIADKSLSLPKASLPPMKLKLQFMVMIQQTEALNRKMIQVLKDLTKEYQEAGFPFCLLKGLGNGVNYPSPLLRNAGDLDVFLYRKGDYENSKKWITDKGFAIDQDSHIHYQYSQDGIWIESHNRITFFDHPKYDKLFKEWEAELIEKEDFTTVQIDGLTVLQLPVEMNAFFIFQHLFRHFAHSGVGYRQFCDWLLFLSNHKDKIDPISFTALAESYALLYPMQVFALAAVKYLGASESIFPFEMITDDKHADWVTADILHSGNFGLHGPGKQRPKEKVLSLWFTYKTTLQRSIKFGAISPEHSKQLPINRLMLRLKERF